MSQPNHQSVKITLAEAVKRLEDRLGMIDAVLDRQSSRIAVLETDIKNQSHKVDFIQRAVGYDIGTTFADNVVADQA